MGLCINKQKEHIKEPEKVVKSKVENVDVVKIKLKQARDSINTIIKRKEKDMEEVNKKIKQQVPIYQETGNKKKLVPLLQTKKDLGKMIEQANVRLNLVSDKLHQVELQQMDLETINVLDQSNKFVKELQNQMEKKDWRGILQDAKNKCNLDWPEGEDIEEDPAFQEMWKELGGDKIPDQKTVNVNTNIQSQKQIQRPKNLLA